MAEQDRQWSKEKCEWESERRSWESERRSQKELSKALEAAIVGLTLQVQTARSELVELQIEGERASAWLDETLSDLARLQQEHDLCVCTAAAREADMARLSEELSRAQDVNHNLREEVAAGSAKISRLNAELSRLQAGSPAGGGEEEEGGVRGDVAAAAAAAAVSGAAQHQARCNTPRSARRRQTPPSPGRQAARSFEGGQGGGLGSWRERETATVERERRERERERRENVQEVVEYEAKIDAYEQEKARLTGSVTLLTHQLESQASENKRLLEDLGALRGSFEAKLASKDLEIAHLQRKADRQAEIVEGQKRSLAAGEASLKEVMLKNEEQDCSLWELVRKVQDHEDKLAQKEDERSREREAWENEKIERMVERELWEGEKKGWELAEEVWERERKEWWREREQLAGEADRLRAEREEVKVAWEDERRGWREERGRMLGEEARREREREEEREAERRCVEVERERKRVEREREREASDKEVEELKRMQEVQREEWLGERQRLEEELGRMRGVVSELKRDGEFREQERVQMVREWDAERVRWVCERQDWDLDRQNMQEKERESAAAHDGWIKERELILTDREREREEMERERRRDRDTIRDIIRERDAERDRTLHWKRELGAALVRYQELERAMSSKVQAQGSEGRGDTEREGEERLLMDEGDEVKRDVAVGDVVGVEGTRSVEKRFGGESREGGAVKEARDLAREAEAESAPSSAADTLLVLEP